MTSLKSSRNWGFFFYRKRDLDELARVGYRDIAQRLIMESGNGDSIKKEEKPLRIKPIFTSEARVTFFELHKDFFSQEDQKILKLILFSGDNSPRALIFLDSANRLADSFKKLYEADMITGCQKKELESWISVNFQYRDNHKIKAFEPRYLNNIISTNQIFCKNPVIEVVRDKGTAKLSIIKVF